MSNIDNDNDNQPKTANISDLDAWDEFDIIEDEPKPKPKTKIKTESKTDKPIQPESRPKNAERVRYMLEKDKLTLEYRKTAQESIPKEYQDAKYLAGLTASLEAVITAMSSLGAVDWMALGTAIHEAQADAEKAEKRIAGINASIDALPAEREEAIKALNAQFDAKEQSLIASLDKAIAERDGYIQEAKDLEAQHQAMEAERMGKPKRKTSSKGQPKAKDGQSSKPKNPNKQSEVA